MNSKKEVQKNKKAKKYNYFFYDFVRVTGALPALLWFRVRKIYENNKKLPKMKGYMICSNHTGLSDPIVLMCAFLSRRISFVATTDLYKSKWLNFFFNGVHCIPVDRENFKMDTFHRVKEYLNNNKAVAIFPEGHINDNMNKSNLMPFKSGAILMAYQCNTPIIPVYVVPRKRWYQRSNVVIGEPLNIREICGTFPSMNKINECSELLRQKETELKEIFIRSKYNKNGKRNK